MSGVGIATRGMICRGGSGSGDTIIAWDHEIGINDSLVEVSIDESVQLSIEMTPMIAIELNDLVEMNFILTKGQIITGGLGTEVFGTSSFGDTETEVRDIYSNELDIEINK